MKSSPIKRDITIETINKPYDQTLGHIHHPPSKHKPRTYHRVESHPQACIGIHNHVCHHQTQTLAYMFVKKRAPSSKYTKCHISKP